ncbi:hypothetical protein IGS61_05510 [Janthinobacterium sp. FW305-129]|uniref:hypothetical protein n=1 Tax=Janthinobacterium sp. FW305-129 TaxID=2775054 RepID=UPI001E49204B|nr:hypothetical protein [Janthinobacterium sp. FW305-129]MCC7596933.1 hypothetical protein [Janthinobacterium sp. FW305-129]
MSEGRVVYIDEDPEDIIYFQQFADGHFDVDIIQIDNDSNLEEIVDDILNSPPDAVITDFMLNEKAKVGFNGQALIDMLQERNRHLPCFLLTSHPPDAVAATHDARIVQAKAVMIASNDDLATLFRSQIAKIIVDHNTKLAQAERELEQLVAKPTEERTGIDRDRALELDKYIEEHGLGSDPLPDEIRDERSIDLLTKLILQVDKFLEKN